MDALLHNIALRLTSDEPAVRAAWRAIFDLELGEAPPGDERVQPILLHAAITAQPPSPPDRDPDFLAPGSTAARQVYFHQTPPGGLLTLARPAQVAFDFETGRAQIVLTRELLDGGHLEDLTLIALAPFLRRQGLYMAHAFAASGEEGAVLLCGPSGSGKTSAGLALVQEGWRFLANDAILLREAAAGIEALLSAGTINLDPTSLPLLPSFAVRLADRPGTTAAGKRIVPRGHLLNVAQLGRRAPVAALCFPQVSDVERPLRQPLPRAVGLARLISDSVDQWDKSSYVAHLDFLGRLCEQARCYELHLPPTAPGALAGLTQLLGN
jgi:hypothetical protein